MLTQLRQLLLLCVATFTALAQVPNAGFEQWTSGEPNQWLSNNQPAFFTPVTQSSTAHSGSSALAGEVVTFFAGPVTPTATSGVNGGGFPVNQRHATLTGYYRFSPLSGDRFSVTVNMQKAGAPIGMGELALATTVGSYTQFIVNIDYTNEEVPDTCFILIAIIGANPSTPFHVGSSYLVDDLALTGASTAVEEGLSQIPNGFTLGQNFPNPFNPTTAISYQIAVDSRPDYVGTSLVPQSGTGRQMSVDRNVRLSVFDVLGREVAVLVNESKGPGTYTARWNADRMPSGVYLYRLETAAGVVTKSMLLLK